MKNCKIKKSFDRILQVRIIDIYSHVKIYENSLFLRPRTIIRHARFILLMNKMQGAIITDLKYIQETKKKPPSNFHQNSDFQQSHLILLPGSQAGSNCTYISKKKLNHYINTKRHGVNRIHEEL